MLYRLYKPVYVHEMNIKILGGGFISLKSESYPTSAADAHIPGASFTRGSINYDVLHHHREKLVFRFAMQLTGGICNKMTSWVIKGAIKCRQ